MLQAKKLLSVALGLALVAALALLDNAELSGYTATELSAASSMRYQLVQLVLCREALLAALQ